MKSFLNLCGMKAMIARRLVTVRCRTFLIGVTGWLAGLIHSACFAEVVILKDGRPTAEVFVDARNATGDGPEILQSSARWLSESLGRASVVGIPIVGKPGAGNAFVIARADAWPEVARSVGLSPDDYDAYAIATRSNRVFILGNSESAARHGVADLLCRWGFRWLAPSPRWSIAPTIKNLAVAANFKESPALRDRRIWYAYGMSGEDLKPLMANYERWAVANRLSLRSRVRTGHSYGNIIQRNAKVFEQHPEYFALLPGGKRDNERPVNARKFCFSNPGLVQLVAEDRRRLLESDRRANPAAFMVSVDPSDGEGTCHCEKCAAIGTTTDRVFHLANAVAKSLRVDDPGAWVGLYAYSSHRLPPTIEIEPNVYVQVAMGFNRTEYSLPKLVELWSKKVGAIGLREYYGVEAWDWGLPGRARGGRVGYHQEWIPYYAAQKLDAINAECNANWGAQALGLYVASQLMWNPRADVDFLESDFLNSAFGESAEIMRRFYHRMEEAPPLRPAALVPLFEDLRKATLRAKDEAVQDRLTDLMAYLVYVAKFREFDLVRGRNSSRNDAYYAALKPLMNYGWRIRHRDMVHYYALARRLCNGLPRADNRMDFYMMNKEREPVWMSGAQYSDEEIRALFERAMAVLQNDSDPTVSFSRYLDRVSVPGTDAGSSRIHADKREAVARFRHGLLGYLVTAGPLNARLGIAPVGKPVKLTVFMRDAPVFEKTFTASREFQNIEIELPRSFAYRVEMSGDFELKIPGETPLIYEASAVRPAWVDYSGNHYFYVPRGTRELMVDANPRLSLMIPGVGRRDFGPANRVKGANHIVVNVPAGADAKIWHTMTLTRGQFSLLNVPPLLSFHRDTVFVPREIAEGEELSTRK